MTGEISLGGVFFPTLLLLSIAALILTFGAIRVVGFFGLYRFFAYRALVDLCLFILCLGLLAILSPLVGIPT
jgi:hypothetical protein